MGKYRSRDGLIRCQLSHQSIPDLEKWKQLSGMDMDGRAILRVLTEAAMNTDAADVGYGGRYTFKTERTV